MPSIILFYKKENQLVNKWTGGTTTELCIFPLESDYVSRSFSFRISTATIETEESEFTSLPGFSRSLMMLEGTILLKHNDENPINVKPYDIAIFDGEWKTSSKGKGIDFNVMTTENTIHDLSFLTFEKQWKIAHQHSKDVKEYIGLYSIGNEVRIKWNLAEIKLRANDFVLFEMDDESDILLTTDSLAQLILVNVFI